MGNTAPAVTGVNTSATRVPRVLFFTAGMVPTPDDYSDAEKFRPNVAFRNAAQVSAMPMSPLEECDAVAGNHIPERYLKAYPNVSDFTGERLLRMSDLDRPFGAVSDPDNEAARGAKPPSVGGDVVAPQGAPRPAGAFTAKDGGFVAPQPVGTANLSTFGSERAENAPQGATPHNPQGLPDSGVTMRPARDEAASGTGTVPNADTLSGGGFKAPEPAKGPDDAETGEGEAAKRETAAERKKREAEEAKANGTGTN